MKRSHENEICRRIAHVREKSAGPRGKSTFARRLGLSPSTYDYYEANRVPPAEVLVKIASQGGVSLRWLITGQDDVPSMIDDHPAVGRVARLLADRPDAHRPLEAFLDMLEESLGWGKAAGDDASPHAETPDAGAAAGRPADDRRSSWPLAAETPEASGDDETARWIPVLGRSAAGVAAFWKDPAEARKVTHLDELIERHLARRRPARAGGPVGAPDAAAAVISLSEPVGEGVLEFVAAPGVKARYDDCFALRIDGDSMSPDIAHGDLVVVSPSEPAGDGQPAVVQLAGQIGVTCKLYRRQGDSVHLVPINEQMQPQSFPADKLIWALRVLARVRPQ